MIRTQIQLTEEQAQALRRLSADTGRSLADLVRQAVDLYLRTRKLPNLDAVRERARQAAGKFSSGSGEGSVEHDRLLDEIYLDR
jgi:predicted DNA-binding protein